MQVFRQPFWKTDESRFTLKPFIYISAAFSGCIAHLVYSDTFVFHPIIIIGPLVYFMIFPMCLTQYFYLTFTDDELLIKNGVYTFWHREYKYSDITRISLSGGQGYGRPYIEVFTENNPNYAWSYVIELVSPKDYPDLLDLIKSKNISVETDRGFDYLVDRNFTRF